MKKTLFLSFFAVIAITGFAQTVNNNFVGIGVQFEILKDTLSFISIMNGGPADQAGLLEGDKVLFIDEKQVATIGLQVEEAMNMLRGERKTKVKLKVKRNNEVLDFIVTRDKIRILTPAKDTNGKYGYKDGEEWIVKPIYNDARWFSGEGLAYVKLSNGKCGFIDMTGRLAFQYDDARWFMEGLAAVKMNNKWGFINRKGVFMIPCLYEDAGTFSKKGLAGVTMDGKTGYINKNGTLVIPCQYDYGSYFHEDLAAVKMNDKWGFINKQGSMIIPFQYDNARPFHEGLASVTINEKWGFINKQGFVIISHQYDAIVNPFTDGVATVRIGGNNYFIDMKGDQIGGDLEMSKKTVAEKRKAGEYDKVFLAINETGDFSTYAKLYVQSKINDWQKKGEFEKTTDWQNRVNEATRKEKANQLLKEAEKEYITINSKALTVRMDIGNYDADNEVYLIMSDLYGNLLIPVNHADAQIFKANWNNVKKALKYFIENDKLALAEVVFTTPAGKSYTYSNKASLNYTVANIDYNFAPIEINLADNSNSQKGKQNISTVNLNVGKSDIDVNIPVNNVNNDKTFAVVIANENYQRESQVEFARNDGETFRKYCVQTLGLPEKNVHYTADATLNNIRAEINWLGQVANAYAGEANIIFYYAGHGIPDESSKTAYLLPIDGYGSDVTTGYKLHDLYQKLGDMPAKSVAVFMDACFSGAQRSGAMLASARGVAIKIERGKPSGNTIVFSAAQGDETAYPYREKGHGLFTYFLLKKLQETKGNVTLGELDSYIATNVRQQSIVVNSKSQTPTVSPSPNLVNWQILKLK